MDQWNLLSKPPFSMLDVFSRVDNAIDTNADLADAILETAVATIGVPEADLKLPTKLSWKGTASKTDIDKTRSTIHQLYRDWSAEGEVERSACFTPIIKGLSEIFPPSIKRTTKILVPGAGLGRLVFELCREGYDVEGNELSYHQLFASSFILNHTTVEEEWALHPWALSFSNNLSREDQLRKVMIPDVCPRNVSMSGSMNMTTGDFCVLYHGEDYSEVFDAVVTLFFIDTAPNLINYITTVKHCLKPGGRWVNVGPLLWHCSNKKHDNEVENMVQTTENGTRDKFEAGNLGIAEPGAFELCEEEVMALLEKFGFTIEEHDTRSITAGYVQNTKSMLRSVYQPAHWMARKSNTTVTT